MLLSSSFLNYYEKNPPYLSFLRVGRICQLNLLTLAIWSGPFLLTPPPVCRLVVPLWANEPGNLGFLDTPLAGMVFSLFFPLFAVIIGDGTQNAAGAPGGDDAFSPRRSTSSPEGPSVPAPSYCYPFSMRKHAVWRLREQWRIGKSLAFYGGFRYNTAVFRKF